MRGQESKRPVILSANSHVHHHREAWFDDIQVNVASELLSANVEQTILASPHNTDITMILTLALSVSLLTPAADPPASKELFAKEGWYKEQKGKEGTFIGVLQHTPRGKDVVGFGRYNAYRLEMGDKKYREVYVAGNEVVLKPYVNYTVKLTGKAVDTEVEGTKHAEIWPAHIELVPAPPKADPKKDPGK